MQSESKALKQDYLLKLSRQELLELCESLNIKKYKSKNKKELIALVVDTQLISLKNPNSNQQSQNDKTVSIQNYSKPILKWVGGKTQILDSLFEYFPFTINNYHEMFLGGGSVLFELLKRIRNNQIKVNGSIYSYDLNESLIGMYKNIQTNHNELYEQLQILISDYISLQNINENNNTNEKDKNNRKPQTIEEAKTSQESYYYWIRSQFNKLNKESKISPLGSAMFIFLNKTCFRGVYREGPNGFNVPFGNYKTPEIINKEHLESIHNLIQPVVFQCLDFTESFKNVQDGDFVYLDPPYAPETQTSFVKYTKDGFDIDKHKELFKHIHKFKNNDVKMIMSNSDVQLIKDEFDNNNYKINTVLCKRTINSKNPESQTNEVIIRNF